MTDAYLLADGWEWHYDDAAPNVLLSVVQSGGSTEVTIPDLLDGSTHLTQIGVWLTPISMFNDAEGHKITKVLGMPASVTAIGDYAFKDCTLLTSCVLGSGVTTIGGQVWNGCSGLTTITFPDSVGTIGNSDMLHCTSLVSVVVGSSVTYMGNTMFSDCPSMVSITLLGVVAPSVGGTWMTGAPAGVVGHAYTDSDFPTPGSTFNGLLMGTAMVAPAITSTPGTSATTFTLYEYDVTVSSSVTAISMTTTKAGIGMFIDYEVRGMFVSSGSAIIVLSVVDVYGRTATQSWTITIAAHALGAAVKTFVVASDGHYLGLGNLTGTALTDLISAVNAMGIGTLYDVGDLIDNSPTVSAYNVIKSAYVASGLDYHVTQGNHDWEPYFTTVFTGALDYTVVSGNIVWIVLDASSYPVVPLTDTQMDYLETQLTAYKDHLCFILCHEGQTKRYWPVGYTFGEVNNTRFRRIVRKHAGHIGAVIFGHTHSAGTTAGDNAHYIYSGVYGSSNANGLAAYSSSNREMFGYAKGYTVVGVLQETGTSRYRIVIWYQDVVTNSPIASTLYEFQLSIASAESSPYACSSWLTTHDVLVEPLEGRGERNAPIYGDGEWVACYLTYKLQQVLDDNGVQVQSDSNMLVSGDVYVNPGDRVTLPDGSYRTIKSVAPVSALNGAEVLRTVYL